MNLEHFVANLEKLGTKYAVGEPASIEQITKSEQRLKLQFPEPIKMFYKHFNGLSVESPPLVILPLAEISFNCVVKYVPIFGFL